MKVIKPNSITQTIDFSVIIPTYNRISMLEEALKSVLAQDFEGTVEIIVIDDNSSDETYKVVSQKYPEVNLIYLNKNQGVGAARNQGLQITKGKYIAFLDSDDIWKKSYLSSHFLTLEIKTKEISISAVCLLYTAINKKIIVSQKPDLERFTSPIHALLVTSSFICSPSSVILKREVFKTVGLFDETCRVGSDREFYARCYIYGYQPIFTEQPLVIVRKHNQGQLTDCDISKIEQRKQSRITYLKRLYPLIEKQRFYLLPINHLYAEIYSTSAREFFREKYYIQWIKSWIAVAKIMSFKYAMINIIRDLIRFIKPYLPNSVIKVIKKLFLSQTLST